MAYANVTTDAVTVDFTSVAPHVLDTDLIPLKGNTVPKMSVPMRSLGVGVFGSAVSGLNPSNISNIPVLKPFRALVISGSSVSIFSVRVRATHRKHIMIVKGNAETIVAPFNTSIPPLTISACVSAPSVTAQYTF